MPTDFPDYAQASNPPFPISSISKASSPQSVNIPLPVGTLAISLTVSNSFALELLTVTGHVTGADYSEALRTGIFFNYPTQWLIIDPVDTSVDIEVQFVSDLDFLYVGGSVAPVAVALNVNEDVLAQLTDSSGINLGSFTYPAGGLDDSQKILAAGLPSPMAWMRPSNITRINASMPNLTTIPLVTPGAALKLYLHRLQLEIDTVATSAEELQLQDTNGNILASFSTAFQHDIPADLGGIAPLAAGVGVQLHNASTITIVIRGYLTWAEQ